jgi:hypothetical protein
MEAPQSEQEQLLDERELLKQQIKALEGDKAELQATLEKMEANLDQLNRELADAEARIAAGDERALEEKINSQQIEIDNQKEKLEDTEERLSSVREKQDQTTDKAFEVIAESQRMEHLEKLTILICEVVIGILLVVVGIASIIGREHIAEWFDRVFRRDRIRLINLTSPVSRNSNARLTIQVAPDAECTPSVIYRSGRSSAGTLGTRRADNDGRVSWTWKVPPNTTPGRAMACVDCEPGGSAGWSFVIE